jgi:hypothetical protein
VARIAQSRAPRPPALRGPVWKDPRRPAAAGTRMYGEPAGFLAVRNGTHPLPDKQRRVNGPDNTNAKLSLIDAPPALRSGGPLADGPPSQTDGGESRGTPEDSAVANPTAGEPLLQSRVGFLPPHHLLPASSCYKRVSHNASAAARSPLLHDGPRLSVLGALPTKDQMLWTTGPTPAQERSAYPNRMKRASTGSTASARPRRGEPVTVPMTSS